MAEETKSQTGTDPLSKDPSGNASPTSSTPSNNIPDPKNQPSIDITGNNDLRSQSQLSTQLTDLTNESTSGTPPPKSDPNSLQLSTYVTYPKPDDASASIKALSLSTYITYLKQDDFSASKEA